MTIASTTVASALWLCEARIGGRLLCRKATFNAPGQRAIQADRLRVAGTVRFIGNFRARGQIRMIGAQIEGSADLTGAQLTDPYKGVTTHTPLLGVRGPVPGRKAALLVCCHVPDRVSHGLTPLGFQTSQFRVAPTDAFIQNPPSTRGRSLAGRHHGSDDVRIQDQRPSARSARCTAAWAS
jgi:hypothetical protein